MDSMLAMADNPPKVFVSSINSVSNHETQKLLRRLPIKVVAIDEAQVVDPDPKSGWCDILPYK